MSWCKSCGAEIKFVKTPEKKFIQCDIPGVRYTPDFTSKTKVVTADGVVIRANILPDVSAAPYGYIPHWGTCPNAERHKKKNTDDGQMSM